MNQRHEKRMEEQKHKLELLQQKKQIYSLLYGKAFLLSNTYYDHDYAYISLKYYDGVRKLKARLCETKGAQAQDYELFKGLAEKGLDKRNQSVVEFGKVNEQFMKIIGLIQVSFNNTRDLDVLIDKLEAAINRHEKLKLEPEIEGKTTTEKMIWLNKWRIKMRDEEIGEYIKNDVEPTIENLQAYLKREIDEDAKALEKMGDPTNSRCYRICKFFCNP